jgi:hypothetical protein
MKAKKFVEQQRKSPRYDRDGLLVSSYMADFLLDEFEKREAEVRCSRLTRPYTMCHTLMQAWTQIKLDFIVAEPTEASY